MESSTLLRQVPAYKKPAFWIFIILLSIVAISLIAIVAVKNTPVQTTQSFANPFKKKYSTR